MYWIGLQPGDINETDKDAMALLGPVDADACLVGKWGTYIHKDMLAVRIGELLRQRLPMVQHVMTEPAEPILFSHQSENLASVGIGYAARSTPSSQSHGSLTRTRISMSLILREASSGLRPAMSTVMWALW